MDIFLYLLLQILNGDKWEPIFANSSKYKNWIAVLDLKTCYVCRKMHGKIWLSNEIPEMEPPVHPRCRCDIRAMKTIETGTATIHGENGADWTLKIEGKLPEYYISYDDAKNNGWVPALGNLKSTCPGKTITKGIYYNDNGHLPNKEGRIWYEADINYRFGYRNTQRVVYSNDGLIFVTYDHYQTFFEIV